MLTILIPTDFSNSATNAIHYALQLAKKIPCKIIFFHAAIYPVPLTPEVPVVTGIIDKEAIRNQMQNYVGEIFRALKIKSDPKLLSYIVTEDFSVPPQILDAADESGVDFIVMGTHGATGIRKILFGSTTTDVIAKSKVPVLAVPESFHFLPLKNMLHASDLKSFSKELSMILPLAKIFNATLEVVHITDTSIADAKLMSRAQSDMKRRSYKKLKLNVEPATFGKNISQEIKQLVNSHHPDMLIMFRHEHNWLGRLFFNSKTENVVYETKVPILAFNVSEKTATRGAMII